MSTLSCGTYCTDMRHRPWGAAVFQPRHAAPAGFRGQPWPSRSQQLLTAYPAAFVDASHFTYAAVLRALRPNRSVGSGESRGLHRAGMQHGPQRAAQDSLLNEDMLSGLVTAVT